MEDRLATHIAQQDQIDETAFCVGCGEVVYLHDPGYMGVGDGVLCYRCCGEDAAAIDASQMAFEEWREHWQAFYGVPVPR